MVVLIVLRLINITTATTTTFAAATAKTFVVISLIITTIHFKTDITFEHLFQRSVNLMTIAQQHYVNVMITNGFINMNYFCNSNYQDRGKYNYVQMNYSNTVFQVCCAIIDKWKVITLHILYIHEVYR